MSNIKKKFGFYKIICQHIELLAQMRAEMKKIQFLKSTNTPNVHPCEVVRNRMQIHPNKIFNLGNIRGSILKQHSSPRIRRCCYLVRLPCKLDV
jgi:hypothetical protein